MKMMKRCLALLMVIALVFGILVESGHPFFANELGGADDGQQPAVVSELDTSDDVETASESTNASKKRESVQLEETTEAESKEVATTEAESEEVITTEAESKEAATTEETSTIEPEEEQEYTDQDVEETPDEEYEAQSTEVQPEEATTEAMPELFTGNEPNDEGKPVLLEDGTIQWRKEINNSYVTVIADSGVLPEDATLQVSELEDDQNLQKIERAVEEQVIEDNTSKKAVAIESTTSYDIHFEDFLGDEIQPDGDVKVQITGKSTEDGKNTLVYHVDDQIKNVENMEAVDANTGDSKPEGDVEFDTTHFSTYTVVNTSNNQIKVTIEYYDNKDGNPQKIYLDKTERLTNTNELKIGSHEGNWEVAKLNVNGQDIEDVSKDMTVEVAKADSKVQIYYKPVETTEQGNNVRFYDYTLKAGWTYDDRKNGKTWAKKDRWAWGDDETHKENGNKYAMLSSYYAGGTPVSINSPENYSNVNSSKKLCSGYWHHKNDFLDDDCKTYSGWCWQWGYHNYDAVTQNNNFNWNKGGLPANNWTESSAPVTGLLKGVLNDGTPNFNYGQPGFFTNASKSVSAYNTETRIQESRSVRDYITDYQLKFKVKGNTYRLNDVLNASDNTVLNGYVTTNTEGKELGEEFFPMDSKKKTYEESVGKSYSTGKEHNFFFGMRYDISFKLGEYIGDLDYTFAGDDDMWLVLSEKNGSNFENSQVVLDLGGIHSPTPIADGKVDLWEKLLIKYNIVTAEEYKKLSSSELETKKTDFLNIHGNQEYQLTVLYMERGADKSQCYMEFTIPSANVVSVTNIPKAEYEFTKTKADGTALAGATFGLYTNAESQKPTQTVTSGADGKIKFTDLVAGKTYYVKEIAAPDGYLKDDTVYKIVVTQTNNNATAKMYKNDNDLTKEINSIKNYSIEESIKYNKTAEVSDYDTRTYKIDINATSKLITETSADPVDIVLVLDKSGSMQFPSKLQPIQNTKVKLTQNNMNDIEKKYHLGTYYIITNPGTTAKTYKIYKSGNTWRYIMCVSYGTQGDLLYYSTTMIESDGESGFVLYKVVDAEQRWGYLKKSAINLLNNLQNSSPESKVGIVTFNKDATKINGDNLMDISTAKTKVNQLESPTGGTDQKDALDKAEEIVDANKSDNRKKFVILVTDGAPDDGADVNAETITASANALKKNSDVTLMTVGLSLGNIPAAQQLMNNIASVDSNNNKYAYNAESGDELIGVFESIFKAIITKLPVKNAKIVDYVDSRFVLLDDNGDPATEGVSVANGGIAHIDDNGDYWIEWTNQTIVDDPGWNRSIFVKAKEDFIGGNTIPTNKPDSAIIVDKTTLRLPEPSVNVKLLSLTQEDKEITVLKGDNVTPIDLLKEFTTDNIPQIVEIVKDSNGNNIKINIPDNCKLTDDEWKDLVDDSTKVIQKDYSYAGTNDVVGQFKYTIKAVNPADGTLDTHATTTVGKDVEQYQLIVTYVPISIKKEGSTDGRDAPNSENPGAEVTNNLVSTNNYYVNVVTIQLDVTKYGKPTADGTTKNVLEGASFILEKKSGTEWSQVGNEMTSGKDGKLSFGSLVDEEYSLVDGEYRLVETSAPAGYSLVTTPIQFTINRHDKQGSNPLIPIEGSTDNANNYTPGISVSGNVEYVTDLHPDLKNNKFTYYLRTSVDNVKLYKLPNSGGIGTYLFTISGVAIIMTALLLFIENERRRKGAIIK